MPIESFAGCWRRSDICCGRISFWEKKVRPDFPKLSLRLADFVVDKPAVPEALPEVPTEAGEAVEEAELEEVADAEIGDGAEVSRVP